VSGQPAQTRNPPLLLRVHTGEALSALAGHAAALLSAIGAG
jgi:hypothetical protein